MCGATNRILDMMKSHIPPEEKSHCIKRAALVLTKRLNLGANVYLRISTRNAPGKTRHENGNQITGERFRFTVNLLIQALRFSILLRTKKNARKISWIIQNFLQINFFT
jgi:hypothetical protein